MGPVGSAGGDIGGARPVLVVVLELVLILDPATACAAAFSCLARLAVLRLSVRAASLVGDEMSFFVAWAGAGGMDEDSSGVVAEGVVDSHRAPKGSRKVGGRRVIGLRSSSAERRRERLMLDCSLVPKRAEGQESAGAGEAW